MTDLPQDREVEVKIRMVAGWVGYDGKVKPLATLASAHLPAPPKFAVEITGLPSGRCQIRVKVPNAPPAVVVAGLRYLAGVIEETFTDRLELLDQEEIVEEPDIATIIDINGRTEEEE